MTEAGQLVQAFVNRLRPLLTTIFGTSQLLLLNVDHIVDFVDDAIGGDDVTLCNASILNLWATITAQTQIKVVDALHQTNERPIGLDDASTA